VASFELQLQLRNGTWCIKSKSPANSNLNPLFSPLTHHFPYTKTPFLGPKSPYPGDGEGITAPLRAASFRRFNQCSLSLPRQEAWEASCGDSNHQEYDAL